MSCNETGKGSGGGISVVWCGVNESEHSLPTQSSCSLTRSDVLTHMITSPADEEAVVPEQVGSHFHGLPVCTCGHRRLQILRHGIDQDESTLCM